ncbi:MAG: DeoR/GlpR family DNA-binding transcription regulator [Roseovarius sp.]
MLATERKRRILEILATRQQATTGRLAELLAVSRETVRRDLVELEQHGRLRRVHGGAVLPGPPPEAPFARRLATRPREKRQIARQAARLIRPGQCVMVDAGSTTSVFAQELARLPEIMVITNSIDIATTIRNAGTASEVVLLGGRLVSDVPATYGSLTLAEIARFRADIVFVAPVALDPDRGAFYYELHEAELAEAMIAQAATVAVLVDHGKLGAVSRVRCCPTERIDVLISDPAAPPALVARLAARGLQVLA